MRRAFTLVEMLVALVITLIMMAAVVTLFGVITESVSASRSAIEMVDRLRAGRNQLQNDLQGVTATMKPPRRPESDEGYFEIIEGSLKDSSFAVPLPAGFGGTQNLSLFGDVDDVLMFTTRSRGAPFTGKLNGVVIESPVAEVVYFLAPAAIDASGNVVSAPPVFDATRDPPSRLLTLYRRVLLVAPGVGPIGTFNDHFYDANDISIRYVDPAGPLIPNTLGDLTKRENRFAHYGDFYGAFPFAVDPAVTSQFPPSTWPPQNPLKPTEWPQQRPKENAFLAPMIDARLGDDVLLTNVVAFDVQVWDPGAPIYVDSGIAVEPRDPRWITLAGSGPLAGFGAYVDLGYFGSAIAGAPNAVFSLRNPDGKPPSAFPSTIAAPRVYDTWSLHYENDGLDNATNTPGGDFGTNGLDDGGAAGVVDDLGEYDTLPPYSAPLRGIRVTIRVYEPSSQQVREAVVVQDFLQN